MSPALLLLFLLLPTLAFAGKQVEISSDSDLTVSRNGSTISITLGPGKSPDAPSVWNGGRTKATMHRPLGNYTVECKKPENSEKFRSVIEVLWRCLYNGKDTRFFDEYGEIREEPVFCLSERVEKFGDFFRTLYVYQPGEFTAWCQMRFYHKENDDETWFTHELTIIAS